MSDNTTPPVATSSSGEIPVEILTAANAHLSHGKTFGGSPGAETPPTPVSREGGTDPFANLPHAVKAIRFDNVWAHGVISSAIISLQQQLADAELTARYQSDVARQADEAREKAEAENARLRADAARLSRLEELGDFWVVEPRLSEDAWEIRVGNETIGYGADLRDAIDGATPTPPQERKARRRDYTNAVTHSSYSFWLSREHAERLAAEQAVSGTESWNEWKPVPNTEAAYFALKQRVIDEQGATRAASAQERP
jgi:hypothetical protein